MPYVQSYGIFIGHFRSSAVVPPIYLPGQSFLTPPALSVRLVVIPWMPPSQKYRACTLVSIVTMREIRRGLATVFLRSVEYLDIASAGVNEDTQAVEHTKNHIPAPNALAVNR